MTDVKRVKLAVAVAHWYDASLAWASANGKQPFGKPWKSVKVAQAHAIADALRAGKAPSKPAKAWADAALAHLPATLPEWAAKSENAKAIVSAGTVPVPAEGKGVIVGVVNIVSVLLDAGYAPNAAKRTAPPETRTVVVPGEQVGLIQRLGITFEQLQALAPEQIAALKALLA